MGTQLGLFPMEFNEATKKSILLSLQEKYFSQITSGEKKFEYRKSFREESFKCFIYLTSPKMCFPGYLELGQPIAGSPMQISSLAEKIKRGHGEIMLDYMQGRAKCYAIPIKSLHLFESTIFLSDLKRKFPGFNPPQSYMFLDKKPNILEYFSSINTYEKIVNKFDDIFISSLNYAIT